MAPTGERLTADERRETILAASLKLFARHGFHGVTTRMIAHGAGISEALLYRHFESKDDLFRALETWCIRRTVATAERLAALEPSTAALVLSIHFMIGEIMRAPDDDDECTRDLRSMNLASLLEDGKFARAFLQANIERFIPKLVEFLEAAESAGDLTGPVSHATVRVWLCHHLPVMTASYYLPKRKVVDHGVDPKRLIEEVTSFCLRGLGLRPEAIARTFNPKALALFLKKASDA